jgi:hypothetical protein
LASCDTIRTSPAALAPRSHLKCCRACDWCCGSMPCNRRDFGGNQVAGKRGCDTQVTISRLLAKTGAVSAGGFPEVRQWNNRNRGADDDLGCPCDSIVIANAPWSRPLRTFKPWASSANPCHRRRWCPRKSLIAPRVARFVSPSASGSAIRSASARRGRAA